MLTSSMPSAEIDANETASALPRIFEQRAALLGGEPLGIVEAVRDALGIEDHGGGDHRSGERAAAGFVQPGHRPQSFAAARVSWTKSGFSIISKSSGVLGVSGRARAMAGQAGTGRDSAQARRRGRAAAPRLPQPVDSGEIGRSSGAGGWACGGAAPAQSFSPPSKPCQNGRARAPREDDHDRLGNPSPCSCCGSPVQGWRGPSRPVRRSRCFHSNWRTRAPGPDDPAGRLRSALPQGVG